MPKLIWPLAAVAILAVFLFGFDPLGLFDADEDGSQDGADALDALDFDGPELQGHGGVEDLASLKEYKGDPVGVFDFRMGSGVLRGRVTGNEQPLPLARVRPVLPPPFGQLAVRTAENGGYELRGLPFAQHELRVSKEGWVARTHVAPMIAEPETKGETVEVEVEAIDLRRQVDVINTLVVRVRDPFGRPVAGA